MQPVAFQLGGLEVHWYGILIGAAIVASFLLVAVPMARRYRVSEDELLTASIAAVIGAMIGARLMFVLLKWSWYSQHLTEIWRVDYGGLSIHGALLGGLVGLLVVCAANKYNFARLADIMAPAVAAGQAIGRFGNFFNSEAFGGPTNLPWKMFVAPEFRPVQFAGSDFFHPTFIYESLGSLLVLWLLLRLARPDRPAGHIALWYLILYSCLRFLAEFFRVDSDALGALTIAQWASLVIIPAAYYLLTSRKT